MCSIQSNYWLRVGGNFLSYHLNNHKMTIQLGRMGAPTLQIEIFCTRWSCFMVFKGQKISHRKFQMIMVQAIPNLVLSSQQHYFVGCTKQIWSTPHPCKCQQNQALLTFWGFLRTRIRGSRGGGGGDLDEQLEWNKDNKPGVEDDKQPEANNH
jgi:hypothetical protein